MRRVLLTLALCLLLILPTFADTSGPNNPGTIADDGTNGGDETWSNPSLAASSNDLYANAPCGCVKESLQIIRDLTHYLKATNFGFAIASDATINAVEVNVERHASGAFADVVDSTVSLVVSGDVSGDNLAIVGQWPSSDFVAQYGPTSWGLSLTPAQVNASNFGMVISAEDALFGPCPTGPVTALVDHIQISITYTPAPPPPPGMPRRTITISRSAGVVEVERRITE